LDFLLEVTLFLLAAVVAVPIFQWLGFGAVLGYLVAGVVMGPSLFGVIDDVESMLQFSKIGVILLLFLVGLELAPQRLWVMRHNIFGLGMAGVVVCAVPIGLVALWSFGLDWQASLIVGLGLSFSSTAFAMQVLAEHNELSSPWPQRLCHAAVQVHCAASPAGGDSPDERGQQCLHVAR